MNKLTTEGLALVRLLVYHHEDDTPELIDMELFHLASHANPNEMEDPADDWVKECITEGWDTLCHDLKFGEEGFYEVMAEYHGRGSYCEYTMEYDYKDWFLNKTVTRIYIPGKWEDEIKDFLQVDTLENEKTLDRNWKPEPGFIQFKLSNI